MSPRTACCNRAFARGLVPRMLVAGCFALAIACGGPASTVATPVGVRLRADTTWYDVGGSSRATWLSTMHTGAAAAGVQRPFFASTVWKWQWSSALRSGSTLCAYSHPGVELTINYIMPRLRAESVAPEDQIEWLRFSRSLWTHESGHALRATRAASELRDALVRMSEPGCDRLQTRAQETLRAIQAKYVTLQADYDARTRHGARQGATLLAGSAINPFYDPAFRDTVP